MGKIVAANFKCHHTPKTTLSWLKKLDSMLPGTQETKVFVFPNQTALCENSFKNLKIGAQNAYPTQNGAFTGEIGSEILEELDVKAILIGHSERRNVFGENASLLKKKFDFFARKGFDVFYCIGEESTVRKRGMKTLEDFLRKQIQTVDASYENLILAYEPIWAIGSGKNASIDQIAQTHALIKNLCPAPILYGGSVNAANSGEILRTPFVDGVLVGSASLEVESFHRIVQSVKEAKTTQEETK